MVESEGSFDYGTWEAAAEAAKSGCLEATAETLQEDIEMIGSDNDSLGSLLRATVVQRVRDTEQWRQSIK